MLKPLPEPLAAAIQAYKTAVPRRARLLDLAGAILGALAAAAPAPAGKPEPLDQEAATNRLAAGQALLVGLPIPVGPFRSLLAQLFNIFQQFDLLPAWPPEVGHELLELSPADWLVEEGPAARLATVHHLPVGLLLFIGQKALAPWYQQAAAPYAALWSHSPWQKTICPACGRPPILALITPESGHRHLHCSLCAVTWPAPSRQACVFCGAEAAQTTYYFLEDDPARRADLCQSCGRYLKTLVLANLPHPLHLPLEEFVLADLDTLMARLEIS